MTSYCNLSLYCIGILYYTIYYIRIPLQWLRVYKCGVSTYIGSLVTRVTVAGAVCVCVCVYHLPRIYQFTLQPEFIAPKRRHIRNRRRRRRRRGSRATRLDGRAQMRRFSHGHSHPHNAFVPLQRVCYSTQSRRIYESHRTAAVRFHRPSRQTYTEIHS